MTASGGSCGVVTAEVVGGGPMVRSWIDFEGVPCDGVGVGGILGFGLIRAMALPAAGGGEAAGGACFRGRAGVWAAWSLNVYQSQAEMCGGRTPGSAAGSTHVREPAAGGASAPDAGRRLGWL